MPANRLRTLLRTLLHGDPDAVVQYVVEFARSSDGDDAHLLAAAFLLAVRQRFLPQRDVRDVIRFVADTRKDLNEDIRPDDAEALIGGALGIVEPSDITVSSAVPTMQLQLLLKLLIDARPSGAELDAFLTEAERTADSLRRADAPGPDRPESGA